MPQQASTVAADIDGLFDFITYWICLPFFVLIVAAMCYCVWKYRSKPGGKAEDSTSHNTPLELTWTIIPTILVLFIFWWGFTGYMDLMTPPDDAYEVDVTAQQWDWQFRYPSTGLISKELHVPPNTPVVLNMLSMDVLHGFFVPEFRVKYDIVPIESFTKKPEVIELCRMLGTGQMNQSAAQAAAWHFTDGLSWPQLVHKIGARHLNGTVDRYFHPNQVRLGMQYAKVASDRAKLHPSQVDKIESLSNQ